MKEKAAVVRDAEAYQRLLDIAAYVDREEGIRQGLEDAKKRNVRPAIRLRGLRACPLGFDSARVTHLFLEAELLRPTLPQLT